MSPPFEQAVTMLDEFIRRGVLDVVLAPGSRSAPLAIAAAAAARRGEITLHVRIDERSAGFLALGLSLASRRPVVVMTTSGSAGTHLHPAVVEASYAGVSLIVMTADRPPRLHGIGANQTVDQQHLFGSAVRWFRDLEIATQDADPQSWRSVVAEAVRVATLPADTGPVHLNIAFEAPLVPPDPLQLPAAQPLIPHAAQLTPARTPLDTVLDDVPARGVIVVGHPTPATRSDTAAEMAALAELAAAHGWPVLSEPSGGAMALPTYIAHAPLLVAGDGFLETHVADVALVVGAVGLDRGVTALIERSGVVITVDPRPPGRRSDPTRRTVKFLDVVPSPAAQPRLDAGWLAGWRRAGEAASACMAAIAEDAFSGAAVATAVWSGLSEGDQVLLAASWPVRQVFAFARSGTVARVIGNRGASGIDGLISTAWGAALRHPGTTFALLGDLAFLHDHNGLLSAPGERRPDLVIVVADNNGGGIFSSLEQRDVVDFERVFATPHDRDLAAIAVAAGVDAITVTSISGLVDALSDSRAEGGVRVVVAKVLGRRAEADLWRMVQGAVAASIAPVRPAPGHRASQPASPGTRRVLPPDPNH